MNWWMGSGDAYVKPDVWVKARRVDTKTNFAQYLSCVFAAKKQKAKNCKRGHNSINLPQQILSSSPAASTCFQLSIFVYSCLGRMSGADGWLAGVLEIKRKHVKQSTMSRFSHSAWWHSGRLWQVSFRMRACVRSPVRS